MDLWRFYDYLDSSGVNVVREWLDTAIPRAAAAKINARLLFMRAIPIWPEQYVSALTAYPGLLEMRVVLYGNQYRPLGFYGPARHDFTIVMGTIEKGRIPKRDLDKAYERRIIALADSTRICEHHFD